MALLAALVTAEPISIDECGAVDVCQLREAWLFQLEPASVTMVTWSGDGSVL